MKVVLTEEQKNNLKLEPFIYKAILNKNTSLGDNPAIPPYGDFGLEYHVVKNKFEEVSEIIDKYIEDGKLESKDPDYLISVLSQKIIECKQKEEPIRPQLQKLCENIVNGIFAIPVETVLLECKLTDEVKPENSIRVLPEEFDEFDENAYNFEDVDEVELANKAILKRRFINCLIQGLSYWLSTDIDDWCDTVVGLDKDIWNLWYNIIHISDYLLFVKDQKIDEKHPKLMSYVEVKLGRLGKKTSIKAQGVILPYLLRDTIRGFLELFSSHGLPSDSQKAMYIVRKADFLVAEPWDLRLGMGIVDMLHTSLTNIFQSNLLFTTQRIPYFFKMLCSLKTDEFNSVMKNFLLHTNKGKIMAKEIDDSIARDIDYQKFKDRIQQKNIETSVINDGDFSKEELDGYVLQENETDEMMAYHGSGNDFDKFNHKKYLNTGAGSQSFGWGTYITNDESVAKGYTDISLNVQNINKNDIIKVLCNSTPFYISEKEAIEFVERFYKLLNGYNLPKHNGEIDITTLLGCGFKKSDVYKINIIADYAESINKGNILYTVDIPEDNGQNYIEWYEHFPPQFMKRVLQGFLRIHDKHLDAIAKSNYPFKCDLYGYIKWMKANPNRADKMMNNICSDDNYEDFFSSSYYTYKQYSDGGHVYGRLKKLFGSAKAASLFLMQCGFDGMKYPAGTKWSKPAGASEDAYNYVIFDANKVKIVNKTRL